MNYPSSSLETREILRPREAVSSEIPVRLESGCDVTLVGYESVWLHYRGGMCERRTGGPAFR